MTHQHHPSDETLAQFAEGKLIGARQQEMLRHLDTCADCREITVANFKLLESEASPQQEHLASQPDKNRSWLWRLVPLCAALVLAVLLWPSPSQESLFATGVTQAHEAIDHLASSGSQALSQFKLSLELSPGTSAVVNRGASQPVSSAQKNALDTFERISPEHASFLQAGLHRISLMLAAGEYASAIETASALREFFPQDKQLLSLQALATYMFAQQLKRPQDTKAALQSFANLQKTYPNDPDLAYNLGSLYWAEQQFDQAARLWHHYLSFHPDDHYAARIRSLLSSE